MIEFDDATRAKLAKVEAGMPTWNRRAWARAVRASREASPPDEVGEVVGLKVLPGALSDEAACAMTALPDERPGEYLAALIDRTPDGGTAKAPPGLYRMGDPITFPGRRDVVLDLNGSVLAFPWWGMPVMDHRGSTGCSVVGQYKVIVEKTE